MNPFLPESIQKKIVLASKSPRRIEILKGLGMEFRVEPAGLAVEDEELNCPLEDIPPLLAGMKARDVAPRFPDSLVIGADTVVLVDGEVLEKPRDRREAAAYLKKLSGKTHEVITGVALRKETLDFEIIDKETTEVRFRELDEDEIRSYIASGEGEDKAGAYAIQGLGSCLVERINGCFYNVVGLPVNLLIRMMKEFSQVVGKDEGRQ